MPIKHFIDWICLEMKLQNPVPIFLWTLMTYFVTFSLLHLFKELKISSKFCKRSYLNNSEMLCEIWGQIFQVGAEIKFLPVKLWVSHNKMQLITQKCAAGHHMSRWRVKLVNFGLSSKQFLPEILLFPHSCTKQLKKCCSQKKIPNTLMSLSQFSPRENN